MIYLNREVIRQIVIDTLNDYGIYDGSSIVESVNGFAGDVILPNYAEVDNSVRQPRLGDVLVWNGKKWEPQKLRLRTETDEATIDEES